MSKARNKKSPARPATTRTVKSRKVKSAGRPSPKKSTGKKTSRKKKSRTKTTVLNWKKRLFIVFALAIALLLGHVWSLNNLIEQRFDGETWARPSRVYARPLELYAGLKINPQQLMLELKLADYQAVERVTRPGHYSFNNNIFDIYSRDFYFSDHHQQEAKVRLKFRNEEVMEMIDLTHQITLEFYQLTPAIIGSYLPGNGEDRLVIEVDDMPPELIDILLAVEDKKFYSHMGVSPLAILRALLANIRAGKTVQGGSTLTQQLAKNMFLTPERSLIRKINEALMSLMLEARFSKDAILAAYLNEVFLLQQKNTAVHGFALASKLLFKQPLRDLPKHKLALLVGMVKGPSVYNPLVNPQRATERRNLILRVMQSHKQISQGEYKTLSKRPLGVTSRLPPVNPYPAYLDLVKKQLKNSYSTSDLAEKGLHIYTVFDPIKQRQLEQGLQQGLNRFNDKQIQSAVVMADYLNGDLIALTGDRDTDFPGFNRAILAQRPIGSLIKPMLLYGLLQSGKTLASKVEDRPIRIKQSNDLVWSPQNYDKKLHGEMTLYQAFVHSYNLPFVHLGVEGNGLKTLTENLQKINLLKQQVIYPSILLGATLMTPYEVAQMYQVIANSGYFTPLTTIRNVMDNQHEVLTRIPLHSDEVFGRQTMVQVQRALIGVAEEGTARYLKSRYSEKVLAGKTGTTNDLRDSWFSGFSNRYLTVVWLGRDNNKPINLTGSSGALRVWADIMGKLDIKSVKLGADPTLEWNYIDRLQGGKSGENCEGSVLLPFKKGTQPDFNSDCTKNYLEKGIRWLQEHF